MDKNSDWLSVSTAKIKADMKLREEAKKLKGKPKKPKAAKDSDLSEPAKAGSEKWGNTQSATVLKPGENGNAVINPTPPAKAKKLEIHNSDAGTASTVWMERFYVEMNSP